MLPLPVWVAQEVAQPEQMVRVVKGIGRVLRAEEVFLVKADKIKVNMAGILVVISKVEDMELVVLAVVLVVQVATVALVFA